MFFSEFFDKYPEAKKIVWIQYTPYFNDGEECVFNVYDFELKFDESNVADDELKGLIKSNYNDYFDDADESAEEFYKNYA